MIKELIRLYRQCELDAAKWSDRPVDLEYFISWLEENANTDTITSLTYNLDGNEGTVEFATNATKGDDNA